MATVFSDEYSGRLALYETTQPSQSRMITRLADNQIIHQFDCARTSRHNLASRFHTYNQVIKLRYQESARCRPLHETHLGLKDGRQRPLRTDD